MAVLSKRNRDNWIAFGVLLGWNLVLYHRVLFLGEVPDGGDQNYLHYPWKTFFLNSVREGYFPFWNPYLFCGMPFFADIQTCTLYPPDWMYFVVPLPWGFGLSYFLHSLSAGMGFYALSGRLVEDRRARLLSALIYSGAGPLVSRLYLGNAVVIASYAWAPLCFHCAMGLWKAPCAKRLSAFTLVSALFILAGHPQIPFLIAQLLFAYLLWRSLKDFRRSGLREARFRVLRGWSAVTLGGLMSLAVVILQVGPFLELAGYSATRAGGASYEFASEGSMPVRHLLTLFLPYFFGDPTTETYWGSLIPFPEICGYIGCITLFLILGAAFFSRRRETIFWLGASLLAALLALGEFTPVHRIFYSVVPGWDLFRQPGRSLFLFAFSGSLLAGMGFEALNCGTESSRSKRRLLLGGAAGFSVLVLVGGYYYLTSHRDQILNRFAETENAKVWGASSTQVGTYVPENFLHRSHSMERSILEPILYLSGFVGVMIVWRKHPTGGDRIGWVLFLLVAVDLYRFGNRFLSTMPEREWRDLRHPRSELALRFSEEANLGRLLQPDTALDYRFHKKHPEFYPNGPMAQGIRTVRGYSATILSHYNRFINTIQDKDPETLPGGLLILDRIHEADPLGLAVMGVRRMIDYQARGGPFRLVEERREGLFVYELESSLPRCFRAVPSGNRWGLEPVDRSHDRTTLLESSPNRLVARTWGEKPAELVFSDCYYPGWTATVGGSRVAVSQAFLAFQKAPVPSGESEVVWEFRPPRLEVYATISGIAFLVTVLLGFLPRNRPGEGALNNEVESADNTGKVST